MNGSHPEATVNRGMLVELPCRVILSNPSPDITWYKDGEILDDEQLQWEGIAVLTNGSLIISYSTQQHEGTYECVASNIGGTVSQATTLHVLGKCMTLSDRVVSAYSCTIVELLCHGLGG
jgi:hypothetical protein